MYLLVKGDDEIREERLFKGRWFKGKKEGEATLNLKNAKRYATWQEANEACEGTSWKFCHEDEVINSNKKAPRQIELDVVLQRNEVPL